MCIVRKRTIVDCENNFSDEVLKMIDVCDKSIIYFHNFGRYDSTFILNSIISIIPHSITILERNNIIYELKIKQVSKKVTIRDSLLLIPLSLDSISKSFCRINKKK